MHSPFLLQEALDFRKTQASLYNSEVYPVVLAAAFAQETAADPMLATFYETLFVPYRAYYTPDEFDAVAEYFLVHITGVEQRHSDDAKRALFRACRNEEDSQAALRSLTAFWEAQSNLWNAIYREMQRHQSELNIVPTHLREEFLGKG